MNRKQIVVKDILTTYAESGQGPVVLLLHGWGDTSSTFTKLAAELAKQYTVLVVDLPGFGQTQAPKDDWALDNYAVFVAAFLQKLDKEPYAIVGHSNGGAIAIRGIGKGILQPEKLVLLASSGIREVYKGRNKALRLVTKAGKALTTPLPKTMKKKLRQQVYETVGSDMLVAENLQGTFKLIVRDDVQKDAPHIQVPTLLIYGNKDRATPVAFGQTLAQLIPKSQLEILEAGHFVHHDQPEKVAALIEEFLK